MIELAAVFLSGIVSMAVSGIVGNKSDVICSNLFTKTKELLGNDENKYINHDIEKSITSGYYFALYYCGGECKRLGNILGDKNLIRSINLIEDIIDNNQKSKSENLFYIFKNTKDIALLINENPEKKVVKRITDMLIYSTFRETPLPLKFKEEIDQNLFKKMRSYFVEEIKTNQRVKNFLDTRMLAEIKENIEDYLPEINKKLDLLLNKSENSLDTSYDLKLKLMDKFHTLFSFNPLKEALLFNINDLPLEMRNLYKESNPQIEDEKEDDFFPPSLTDLLSREETEHFVVKDEINSKRLFFIVNKNETPLYLYPKEIESNKNEIIDGKIYRTFQVKGEDKVGDNYLIVSLLLEKGHGILETYNSKKGGLIDNFPISKVLEYTKASDKYIEFEKEDEKLEIYYGMDNPEKIFLFVDVEEKKLIRPKIKYDFQLKTEYGTLTVNKKKDYIVISISFFILDEKVEVNEFYNTLREEVKKGNAVSKIETDFAFLVKTRLLKLYNSLSYNNTDILDYFNSLFKFSVLSCDDLENEMDNFIHLTDDYLKGEKDKYNILGLCDLKASALYNKSKCRKDKNDIQNQEFFLKEAIKLVKAILKVQSDFPLKRSLDFYEEALNI